MMASCTSRRTAADVALCGSCGNAVPDRQEQGVRAIPHGPVPARAAAGEGAQHPGPASAQGGLGLDRAAPAVGTGAAQPGGGGSDTTTRTRSLPS